MNRDIVIVMDRKIAQDWNDYPSYTLTQLKKFVEENSGDIERIKKEIAAREAGISVIRVTPQIMGGKVQTKVGRM